jgi:hypothetical protein
MEDIVMETPVVKAGSMPANVRQEDSLLNKESWTRLEVSALDSILEYYQNKFSAWKK